MTSASEFTQFSVPTEATVFGCSLLAYEAELVLAKQAVQELWQSHPDSTPSNVMAVYMSPWKSHLLTFVGETKWHQWGCISTRWRYWSWIIAC